MTVATARLVFFVITFAIYPLTNGHRTGSPDKSYVFTSYYKDTVTQCSILCCIFYRNNTLQFSLISNCSSSFTDILARVRIREDMNEIIMKEIMAAGKSTVAYGNVVDLLQFYQIQPQ